MVDHDFDAVPGITVTRRTDAQVRVVRGGNHVTTLLPAPAADGSMDAIVVRADPGGGPPPHRHEFGEWFHVLEGALEITTAEGGEIVPLATAGTGDSVWVPPNAWHGTVNASDEEVRFLVVGVPGVMTAYFEEAGVRVPDENSEPTVDPPGPDQLGHLRERFGITFF
jgi:quercetin dioxygenase-like cupin family protein